MEQNLGYVCFYDRQRWECYASNLLEAREQAIAHFQKNRRSKVKPHMLSVVLAEKDGKPVVHSTAELG